NKRNEFLSCDFDNNQSILDILLCFDDNYALPAGVNIFSIVESNPLQQIHFHLFTHNLSDENRRKFSGIKFDNIAITEYVINDEFKIDEQNTEQFPLSACVRLIAPIILKNTTDKLLYVDSDTLCINSLADIDHIDLKEIIVAAIADVPYMQQTQCAKYDVVPGTYFNSGVMLINISLWCEEEITDKTLRLLNSGEKYQYPDQDVLNICVGQKRLILPRKFNNLLALSINGNDDANVPNGTIFIHYITKNKPWHQPYRSKLFDSYLEKSPWRNDNLPLYCPKKTSSIRAYAKLMFRQKKYLAGIKHYIIYLKTKFKK
ncbi:glycosyltransferase family 8 protein, partial [Gilliamella sp. N-G2]|uniref:glycosyltransferase family 8 protein n=2 Tax=unclassified Gilliamella TaxID=2685620 RepID=UPI001C1F3DEE